MAAFLCLSVDEMGTFMGLPAPPLLHSFQTSLCCGLCLPFRFRGGGFCGFHLFQFFQHDLFAGRVCQLDKLRAVDGVNLQQRMRQRLVIFRKNRAGRMTIHFDYGILGKLLGNKFVPVFIS